MNPFIKMEAAEDSREENLPMLKEFAWDFVHDTFRRAADGTLQTVTKNEALKVWVYKALKTERYRYEAYLHGTYNMDSSYGVRLEEYIGAYPNNVRTETMIAQSVKECLAVNPYIKSIDYVRIDDLRKDRLVIGVGITSVYGSFDETYPI